MQTAFSSTRQSVRVEMESSNTQLGLSFASGARLTKRLKANLLTFGNLNP